MLIRAWASWSWDTRTRWRDSRQRINTSSLRNNMSFSDRRALNTSCRYRWSRGCSWWGGGGGVKPKHRRLPRPNLPTIPSLTTAEWPHGSTTVHCFYGTVWSSWRRSVVPDWISCKFWVPWRLSLWVAMASFWFTWCGASTTGTSILPGIRVRSCRPREACASWSLAYGGQTHRHLGGPAVSGV